jgi:hypothetical protein
MVLVALLLAGFLLAASAFLMFGVPWLVMGPRAFDGFARRADQRALAGVMAMAILAAALLPFAGAALISSAGHMQVFAETILGVPARFWS